MAQHRSRLSFRNIVWALHSESEDILLQAATDSCTNGKMVWSDAKRLGTFLWLKNTDTIVSTLRSDYGPTLSPVEIATGDYRS
jgi:hypothetical protein